MKTLVIKLNGWPETFDERALAIADAVDDLHIIRSKPITSNGGLERSPRVTVHNIPPTRGSYVQPSWLKPFVFPVHVILAVCLFGYLWHSRGYRPDVIHSLDYALGGVAGAVMSELFPIPFVVSVRGLKEPRYRSIAKERGTIRSKLRFCILTIITGFSLSRADHVVTKAPYQVAFIRETFGINPDFTTVPTGVDFDVFDPNTVSPEGALCRLLTEEGHDISETDRVMLYLAKLLPEKGPDMILKHLVQAGSELPDDIVFAFVGEFRDEAFERRFRALREEVRNRIAVYPRRIEFKTVPGIIADADAVVLLSELGTEGIPRVLQEACAMGTPIVASDVDGIKGGFTDLPGCHLVDRDDPEAFVRAIDRALTESNESQRDRAADRFDMSRNYAQYASIYDDLSTQSV